MKSRTENEIVNGVEVVTVDHQRNEDLYTLSCSACLFCTLLSYFFICSQFDTSCVDLESGVSVHHSSHQAPKLMASRFGCGFCCLFVAYRPLTHPRKSREAQSHHKLQRGNAPRPSPPLTTKMSTGRNTGAGTSTLQPSLASIEELDSRDPIAT